MTRNTSKKMIMRPEIKAKIEGFMNALGVPDVTKERESLKNKCSCLCRELVV